MAGWFVATGIIHSVIEGYVVLHKEFYTDRSGNVLAEICMSFSISCSAWPACTDDTESEPSSDKCSAFAGILIILNQCALLCQNISLTDRPTSVVFPILLIKLKCIPA